MSSTSGSKNDVSVFEETSAPSITERLALNIKNKPVILLRVLSTSTQPTGFAAERPTPNISLSMIGSCCPARRLMTAGFLIPEPEITAPVLSNAVARSVVSDVSRFTMAIPVCSLSSKAPPLPPVDTSRG